jgi:hypothetical protein
MTVPSAVPYEVTPTEREHHMAVITLTSSPSAAIDAINIAVGEVELALEAGDPRRTGLRLIQGGLDDLYRVELERERSVA